MMLKTRLRAWQARRKLAGLPPIAVTTAANYYQTFTERLFVHHEPWAMAVGGGLDDSATSPWSGLENASIVEI